MLVGLSIGVFVFVLAAVSALGYWFFNRREQPRARWGGAHAPWCPSRTGEDDRPPEWASTLQSLAQAAPVKSDAKPELKGELAAAGIRASWAPAVFPLGASVGFRRISGARVRGAGVSERGVDRRVAWDGTCHLLGLCNSRALVAPQGERAPAGDQPRVAGLSGLAGHRHRKRTVSRPGVG